MPPLLTFLPLHEARVLSGSLLRAPDSWSIHTIWHLLHPPWLCNYQHKYYTVKRENLAQTYFSALRAGDLLAQTYFSVTPSFQMKSVVQKLVFFSYTVDCSPRYFHIYWPICKCMYHNTLFSLILVSANNNVNTQAKPGNQNRGRTFNQPKTISLFNLFKLTIIS